MSDKTNEEIYRAYLLAYACSGDASKVAVLQDARPLTSAVAAALALAERDRQSGEPPDTWDSLTERLQAMFDDFDPNGYDLASEDDEPLDDEEDGEEPIAS
ncbi:hypothetical protein [Sorangium sp. So ce233]|uniref:hypothetical protein n=1 Tax=Sorangium sp. So ce233 TaxID=3133290 RepID=UPI003F5ED74B